MAAAGSSYALADSSAVTFSTGGGQIAVSLDAGQFELPQPVLIGWVKRAARAVTSYYGRFPVSRARIFVVQGGRRGVTNG